MAKTSRKAGQTGQTSESMPNQPPPQSVAEDEPQVELEEEDLRTTLIRDTTIALEAASQLARGQPTPASQPDHPPSSHPQQNLQSEHPKYHHNPSHPWSPQRPEQPPTAQHERPTQNPDRNNKQQPPS
ncbi:RNA polymerase II degradation factor 1-like [Humulus lupulus]|uniref:RNA polymerase II degradation factor 1-like n=1 Tax=Humulus lupulus TaxID=3486 RepID=UPI002B40AD66|nr:RNA polymerase II degradation factor 1-like [Humulus lupulus]